MNEAPPRRGAVVFVGAGPGAADLITLRGAARIAAADIIIWAASLVTEQLIRDHARPDAEIVDSALTPMEGILPTMMEFSISCSIPREYGSHQQVMTRVSI